MMEFDPEVRRPGITRLADRLLRENPRWTRDRAFAEAKVLYTSPKIIKRAPDGSTRTVPNPDYLPPKR